MIAFLKDGRKVNILAIGLSNYGGDICDDISVCDIDSLERDMFGNRLIEHVRWGDVAGTQGSYAFEPID